MSKDEKEAINLLQEMLEGVADSPWLIAADEITGQLAKRTPQIFELTQRAQDVTDGEEALNVMGAAMQLILHACEALAEGNHEVARVDREGLRIVFVQASAAILMDTGLSNRKRRPGREH